MLPAGRDRIGAGQGWAVTGQKGCGPDLSSHLVHHLHTPHKHGQSHPRALTLRPPQHPQAHAKRTITHVRLNSTSAICSGISTAPAHATDPKPRPRVARRAERTLPGFGWHLAEEVEEKPLPVAA